MVMVRQASLTMKRTEDIVKLFYIVKSDKRVVSTLNYSDDFKFKTKKLSTSIYLYMIIYLSFHPFL